MYVNLKKLTKTDKVENEVPLTVRIYIRVIELKS